MNSFDKEMLRDFYKTPAGRRMSKSKVPFLVHDGRRVYSPVTGRELDDVPSDLAGPGDNKRGLGEVLKMDFDQAFQGVSFKVLGLANLEEVTFPALAGRLEASIKSPEMAP